jgi:molybdopterin molybdotransferase
MLPAWLTAYGSNVNACDACRTWRMELRAAISISNSDLVVTTGGTAVGPKDHVRPVLAALHAAALVDGVAVRPGHPMLLASTHDGRLI